MKKRRKNLRTFKNSNYMVAEIIGTVLLLAISVAVFSTIYVTVISSSSPPSLINVNLVGTVEGSNIIIEHRGGDSLGLDTKATVTIGNKIDPIIIGDNNYLSDEAKEDDQWNVGEKLVYHFDYDPYINEANVVISDQKSNSMIMMGDVDITPECDLGLKHSINDRYPEIGDIVNITLKATLYRGDLDAISVKINNTLPYGLTYQSHSMSTSLGNYDPITGIWDIQKINLGESVNLYIEAEVTSAPTSEFTQLAILIDGSFSISDSDWNIMRKGLADGLENAYCFPHDGLIELTVIQFGGFQPAEAILEVGPEIITSSNHDSIAEQIRTMNKLGGVTPTACAINLAADTLRNSPDFNTSVRQIINLVTDGKPNRICNCGINNYTGKRADGNDNDLDRELGEKSAEEARNYLISELVMTPDQDEFDAEAVGSGPDVNWLKDYIVWPGGYKWEQGSKSPPGPGWVRQVSNYKEFAECIDELFQVLFGEIYYKVEVISVTPTDVNLDNNQASIRIVPQLPE
jgi:hypothetical protein